MISVVMPVHDEIKPAALDLALESLERQTLSPDEVVVVADGPLSAGLDDVLARASSGVLPLRVVRLAVNSGGANARTAGIKASSGEWIAMADADDTSMPDRLERQWAVAAAGVDVVGAAMEEFDTDSGATLGIRSFPTGHSEIARTFVSRNAVNHPTVLVRRSSVARVGGYRDVPLLEDYDLWVRMLAAGARFANLEEPLVRFRGGLAAQRRRRAWQAWRSEWRLQRTMQASGLVSCPRALWNWLARSAYRALPGGVGHLAYRRLFLTPMSGAEVARPDYDRFRDMRDTRAPIAEQLAEQALRTVGVPVGGERELRILDVGSGYGDTAVALAEKGATVVGLEPARGLHDHAVARGQELGLARLSFRHGGVEDLDAVAQYDLVLLDNVYEHLPDHEGALAAISRSLRDGGSLYLLVPNRLWPIEAHYGLPGLAWMPVPLANLYLRVSGRGTDYRDASYAPTYWSLKRSLRRAGDFDVRFVLPAVRDATVAGSPFHYRVGMALIERFPGLWGISKALLVVATRQPRSSVEPQ